MMRVGLGILWLVSGSVMAQLDCHQQANLVQQAGVLREQGLNAQHALRQLNQQWQAPQASYQAINHAWKYPKLTPVQLSEQALNTCLMALKQPQAEISPLPLTMPLCAQAQLKQQQSLQELEQQHQELLMEQKRLDRNFQRIQQQRNLLVDSDLRALEAFNQAETDYELDLSLFKRQKSDFLQKQSALAYIKNQLVMECNSSSKP